MHTIKLQLELRYKHILDYHKYNRVIISPLLKNDDAQVSIENVNTINEYIVVKYSETGIIIDFRIDRLLIICEGNQHKLEKPNGSIKHVFDLYEKVKSIETFSLPTLMVLGYWGVRTIDMPFENIVSNFNKNHFNNLASLLENSTDIGITIEKGEPEGKKFERYIIGPFQKKDISKNNISLLFEKHNEDILEKNGLLLSYLDTIKTKELNFNTYITQFHKLKKVIAAVNEINID